MIRLQVLDRPADTLPGEVTAALFYSDVRPLDGPSGLLDWRLNGLLTDRLRKGSARGRQGEYVLVSGNGKMAAAWVLFAGGGCRYELTPLTLAGLIGSVLEVVHRAGFVRLALALDALELMDIQDVERIVWDVLDKDRFGNMQVALAWRGPRG